MGGEGPGTEGWAGMAKTGPLAPCVIWDSFFFTVPLPIFEMKHECYLFHCLILNCTLATPVGYLACEALVIYR